MGRRNSASTHSGATRMVWTAQAKVHGARGPGASSAGVEQESCPRNVLAEGGYVAKHDLDDGSNGTRCHKNVILMVVNGGKMRANGD